MKYILFIYATLLISLTVLSFTQVDLNLTLSSWKPYLQIQNQLTNLGYFNRPANSILWLAGISALTLFYLYAMTQASKGKLTNSNIKIILIMSAICGVVSYSVFSHDIFNYMFDARILTKYTLNPYDMKALDFPNDEWIRFMHWTHRTYPYGPIWLLITILPSYLGLQKLLITMILFKLLFAVSYIVAAVYLRKILTVLTKDERLINIGQLLFVLHPLIIIDGLISPHIDLTSSALFLVGLYYFLIHKKAVSIILIILSIGIKFVSVVFVPLIVIKEKMSDKIFFSLIFCFSVGSVVAQAISRPSVPPTFQPWYFITSISLLSLLLPYYKKKYIYSTALILALPLWVYLFYLATGEWKGSLWFI